MVVNANSADCTGWVWFYLDNMRLSGGGIALDPQPANGAKNINVETSLSWTPGAFAASHELYLGTSSGAVATADGDSDPNVLFVLLDETSFDPNGLEFNTQYFWRVDEVNDANPDSPWKGPVWSFTTGNFVVVDDFESCQDVVGEGVAIFDTWMDGWEDDTNGSIVGNAEAPFAETTTVHGGATLPIGTWTHVAVMFGGTTARFYINGTETGNGGFSFGLDKESALHFGSDDPNGGNAFNGARDDVRLYDKALSAAEVQALLTAQ